MDNLTPQEVYNLVREGAADGGWLGFASRVQEAFKKKNEPKTKEWDGVIRPEDIRIDTYSNKVGGFVLGISNGVRVTHIPTGVTVECDEDRSQHRNRFHAMQKLEDFLNGR